MIKISAPRLKLPGLDKTSKRAGIVWSKLVANILFALLTTRNRRIGKGATTSGAPLLDGGVDQYSPSYAQWKASRGRSLYTPGDRLTLTGHMLASQHVEVTGPRAGELLFSPEAAGKAHGNNRRRPFVEFSKAEVQRAIKKAIKQRRRKR
jgi:hypothetical protein